MNKLALVINFAMTKKFFIAKFDCSCRIVNWKFLLQHPSGRLAYANRLVKFGLSEKHTKFEKNFLMVLTNQLIYLVNFKTMRKIFSNYVCFSKSPNFNILTSSYVPAVLRHEKLTTGFPSLPFSSEPHQWPPPTMA